MLEIERLAKEDRFDYLLIESTGISEPLPVAQTFSFVDDEKGIDLSRFSRLDTLVTVVDALNFPKDFGSAETVHSKGMNEDEEDQRSIVNLLTDQIEFANVILINKTDLVSQDQAGELKAILQKLNPKAKIIFTNHGKIAPELILNTGLYDEAELAGTEAWQEELLKEHKPETEEYGISSFVFRDRRPFHPERFWKYISESWPESIIRSKGLFYIASRKDQAVSWSQAGGSLKADPVGVWWASMPFIQRTQYASFIENQKHIESKWDKHYGDRMNELVLIGQYPEEEKIIKELKSCLLTDLELNLYFSGKSFKDNWPF
jgi:G3E family GTPase